jgi:hypothetical protein
MYDDDELDDMIDEWHRSVNLDMSLHEYLGWTWVEYKHWVETNEQPTTEQDDLPRMQWEDDGGVPPRCV